MQPPKLKIGHFHKSIAHIFKSKFCKLVALKIRVIHDLHDPPGLLEENTYTIDETLHFMFQKWNI